MAENTPELLAEVVHALAEAQVATWLFGGWAEELSGIRPPSPHRDIDLLYPAQSFGLLDEFLRTHDDAEEILPKRFTHKRAFRWRGVMIEVFLVSTAEAEHITDFFSTHRFRWPADTFSHSVKLSASEYCAASPAALHLYQEQHIDIEWAYHQYITESEKHSQPPSGSQLR